MKRVVVTFPDRELHVILDNLNTHKSASDGSRGTPRSTSITRRRGLRGSIRSRLGFPSSKANRSAAPRSSRSSSCRSTSMHSSQHIMTQLRRSHGPKKRVHQQRFKNRVSPSCDPGY
jgi:hypothetical protein